MQNPDNGKFLINLIDKSNYFGDDKDKNLFSALAKITYHVRREQQEIYRVFFNKWENTIRKIAEYKVHLPEKSTKFLLINALNLTDGEIKAIINYTRGSISPKDVKEWVRKYETKLQVSQVGIEKKGQTSNTKTNSSYYVTENDTENNDKDIYALESALQDFQGGNRQNKNGPVKKDSSVLDEHEAAEVLNTILTKKKSFVQTQKAKKTKELARGFHATSKGKGKGKNIYSTTGTGRHPFKTGQFKITIEEVKKVTHYRNYHCIGHWHKEYPEPPRNKEKEQHYLETEEAVFCRLLEADEPNQLHDQKKELTSTTSTESHGQFSNFSQKESFTQNHEPSANQSDQLNSDAQSSYNDRNPQGSWDILFGKMGTDTRLAHPRNLSTQNTIQEEACATVDTGCQ